MSMCALSVKFKKPSDPNLKNDSCERVNRNFTEGFVFYADMERIL